MKKQLIILFCIFYITSSCILTENSLIKAMSNYRLSYFRDKTNEIFEDFNKNNCEKFKNLKILIDEIIEYSEKDIFDIFKKNITIS